MATYRYVVADVFTDARGLDDQMMQSLAREMNFSETVFVFPPESGGSVRIRIFTPLFELPFAGHPTLGTAFVLGAPLQLQVITIETGVGHVPVALERDESGRIIFGRMQQPAPAVINYPEAEAALRAVGVERSDLPVELYDNGPTFAFVEVASEQELAALAPDTSAVRALGITGVTCFTGSGASWTVRMFWAGGEDPATGSAAGSFVCHLARHGRIAWGEEITISQGAAVGRPSTLYARAEGGDGLIDAVEVGGQAVTVARGEFRI
jgi:trans-2,3-dihydro-3-hydroxyanthranilate isomerase